MSADEMGEGVERGSGSASDWTKKPLLYRICLTSGWLDPIVGDNMIRTRPDGRVMRQTHPWTKKPKGERFHADETMRLMLGDAVVFESTLGEVLCYTSRKP